ncbi:hypothetical protein NQ314_008360 [Rhamnusium bicolor]|uniref:Nose resistant-to-fluoxetine protein N-terminal domain-containing protein n=1 Tax=Rhamnusium bicolor TaxID=1586634 RepID=A0AAV8YB81_9CUCU|nr:hypothetical protein NQ314_008360 [Rhamnusium bicolor]
MILVLVLDATSKFPYTGLHYASRLDYGNFDQCLSVDHKYEGGRILGKHCNAGLLIPDLGGNITDINAYFKLAVCMPDGCTAKDYNTIARHFIKIFPPLFQDERCQTVDSGTDLTATDIVTITIFAICIALMIVSTIYDFYLHKTESKSIHPACLAFSVLSNGRKLLHISKNSKDQIQTFHGLKVISMMWVVAGHGFAVWPHISITNKRDVESFLHQRYSLYISTAHLAVDTFFFISGFLLAFQYLKSKTKPLMVQVSSIPYMYVHRYLRLTPACLTQTWYLSADMQMFLLSPLILIPISLNLRRSSGFKVSIVELFILNLFCIAMPMALKLVFQDYGNEYDTHSRLINYFMGMMLGLFMRVKQDKPFLYGIDRKYVSITNLITWIIILLGMLATVICYQEVEMNHGYTSLSVFYSLMRPAWCIGLSWIVYSCYHGYGGFVNWLLCLPVFQIGGRLTYCMYLVHLSVIMYYTLTIRTYWYFSDYNVVSIIFLLLLF